MFHVVNNFIQVRFFAFVILLGGCGWESKKPLILDAEADRFFGDSPYLLFEVDSFDPFLFKRLPGEVHKLIAWDPKEEFNHRNNLKFIKIGSIFDSSQYIAQYEVDEKIIYWYFLKTDNGWEAWYPNQDYEDKMGSKITSLNQIKRVIKKGYSESILLKGPLRIQGLSILEAAQYKKLHKK